MPRTAIELVVTDLDGTLWNHQGEVSDDTRATLGELEQREIPILVATGRRVRSAVLGLAQAGLSRLPVVGLNGAVGVEHGVVFHARPFARAAARAVLAAYVDHGIVPVAFTAPHADGGDCLIAPGVSTHPDHLVVLAPTMRAVDFDDLDDHEVVAFSVLGIERERLVPVLARATAHGSAVLSPDYAYGNHNLAVTPFGVNKWTGVLAFCARHGMNARRVLAIGDDDNDREMVASAAVGLAMRHAPVAVRESAHATVDRWSALLDFL